MNEQYLKDLFSDLEGLNTRPRPLSARAEELFQEKVAPRVSNVSTILVQEDARYVVLKILSKGRFAADEIRDQFRQLRLQLEDDGIGHVLALLVNMEHSHEVVGEFNSEMTQRIYSLASAGEKKLAEVPSSVTGLNALTAMLWS